MKKTWENSVDWESDKASSCCTLCTKKFGMLLQRRHHCRSCGRLVCGACSTNKVRIEDAADNRQVDEELQRVCDPCYQIITAKEEKISQEIKQRERKMELLSVTSYLSNCMVDIFFLDGKYKTLCFEETTTIGDLASQLYPNAKLAMFEVFQDMFDGNQYTYLADTDIISDVVSRWRDERKKYVKIVLPVYDSKAVRPINSVIKKNALSDGDLQAFRQRDSVSHAQESDLLRAAEDRVRVLQMEACTLQQELRKANAKIETWRAIYGKTNKTRGLEKTGYSYDAIEEDEAAVQVKMATFADGPSTPHASDKSTGGDTTPMGNKRDSFSWGLRQSFFMSPSSKAPLPSDSTPTPHESSAGTSSEATIEPTLSRTRSSIGEPQLAGMGGRKASRNSFFARRSSYTAESAPSLSVELDGLPQMDTLRLQRQSSMNSDVPDALSILASVPFGCNPVETELLLQQESFLTRSEDDVATFVRTFFNHVVSIEGFVSKYEVFFEQIMKVMQDRGRQLYSDIDQPVSMWLVVIYQMVTAMDTTYECLMDFVEILRPNLRNWLTTLLRLFATFPISNPEALRSIFHLLWKEHLLFEEEVQTIFSQSMIASFCKDIDGMTDPLASSSDALSLRLPGSPHLHSGSSSGTHHHHPSSSGSHHSGSQYIHSVASFAQQLLHHQQQQQQQYAMGSAAAGGSGGGSGGSGAPANGGSLSIGQLPFTAIDKFMTNIINTLQYIIADLLELIPKEFQIMLMFQRLSWQVWEEIIKPWYRQQATDLKFFQALSIYQFLETYGDLIGQFGVDHRKLSERIKLKKGEVYKLACAALVTDLQAVWRECSATGTEMVASNQQPLLYQTSSSMKSLSSGGSDQQAAIAMSLASVASSQQSVHLPTGNNSAGHAVMMMRWSDELLAFVNDVIRRLVHYVEPSQKSNIRMTVLILLFETLNELGPQQLDYLRSIRPTDADHVVRYTAFVNSQIVFMTSLADTQEQAVDRISEELSEALDQKATMIIQRHEEHCEVALEGLAHIWRDQIYDTCRGELLKPAWLSDAKIMHSLKKMMKQQLQGFQQGLVEDLQYSLRMRMRLTGYICEGLVHAYVECLLRNEPGATLSIATIARLNEDLQWLTALIEECRVMMLGTDDIHRVAPSMSPGFETRRRKRLLPFGGNRAKPSTPKSPLPTSSANANANDASTPPPPPPPSTVSLISSPTEALRKAINYTNKQVYDTMLQPLTHLILALQMDKQYLIPFVQEELFRDFGYHCIRVWIVIEHWRGEKRDHIQQEYDLHLKHWRPAVDTLVEPRVDVGYIKDLRVVKSIKIQPLAPLIGGDDR